MNNQHPYSYLRGQPPSMPFPPINLMPGPPFGPDGPFYPPTPIHQGYNYYHHGTSDQFSTIQTNYPSNRTYLTNNMYETNGVTGPPSTVHLNPQQGVQNPQSSQSRSEISNVQNGDGRDITLPPSRPNTSVKGSTLWRLVSPESVNDMFPTECFKITISNVNICVKLFNIVELCQKIGELKAAAFIRPGKVEVTYWKLQHCKKAVEAFHNNYFFGSKLRVYINNDASEGNSAQREQCTTSHERRKRKKDFKNEPKPKKGPAIPTFEIKREEDYSTEDSGDGVTVKAESGGDTSPGFF